MLRLLLIHIVVYAVANSSQIEWSTRIRFEIEIKMAWLIMVNNNISIQSISSFASKHQRKNTQISRWKTQSIAIFSNYQTEEMFDSVDIYPSATHSRTTLFS